MIKNIRNKTLVKRLTTAMLTGGLLVWSTAAVMAAPVELSLDESIAMALKNNPKIKTNAAEQNKAYYFLSQAQAGKGPTLTYKHTAATIKSAYSTDTSDNYDNTLTLTLPLYTGGATEGVIDQAKLGYKIAQLATEQSKQEIKQDATTAYYGILRTSKLLKVSQESVDMLSAHLKNVQAQFSVGTVAKSDVLRSEVELANAQLELIKAQNNYELAISSFNNVIGLPLDTEVAVKDELSYQKNELSLDDSIKYALVHRPEVLQADISINRAKAGITVARSGYLPTVGLSAQDNWYKDSFPGDNNNNWSVAMVLNWSVFDSGVTHAKVKQADFDVEKATQQAKNAKDGTQLDVRQNYLSMKEAEKRIETSQVAVYRAEEDYKIAEVRYSSGVGTNLDVIDSQVALTQAKTNYVQAMYDYNTSKAKLEKAMGVEVK